MKLRKLMVALLVVALMVAILPASVFAAETEVVIFHTNDIHGRAEGDPALDKDGNPNAKGVIGYARYKEVIDAEKARLSDDQVLVFDCGDVTHGTNFATLSKGESMIDLMNMVGVDAMSCGNHEFNYGPERLKELEAAADFPIMAANIKKADATSFFSQNSRVFDVTPELKIGIFGLATPETRVKSSPKHTAGLDFGAGAQDKDLEAFAAVVQLEIDALAAAGANFIIMMGHLGIDLESVIRTDHLIRLLKGLDLAIDGHSHDALAEGRTIKGKDNKDVLMVQTGSHFANIGKVVLKVEGAEVKTKTASLLGFAGVRDLEGDPAILAKVAAFKAANEVVLGEVIGETAVLLDGERDHVRAGETNLGNLVVDSIWKASGADVALSNGGNVRRSVPVGPITMGIALEVLPFENMVTVIRVTGQDIIDALAHGSKAYPGTAGGFPHVAGMSFTIVTTGEGEEETFVRVENVLVGGKPIDPKAYYTLATNDFLAIGGDGYDMFAGAEQVTLLGLMMDYFADEVRELSKDGPFTVEADGRLSFKSVELEEGVPTGESMTYLLLGGLMIGLAIALAAGRRKLYQD